VGSAGAAIAAAGAVAAGEIRTAFVAGRPPGPSRHARPRHGLLPLQLDRRRGPLAPGGGACGARAHRRLGRAPRQRHPGRVLRGPVRLLPLAPPVAALSRGPAPPTSGGRVGAKATRSTCRFAAGTPRSEHRALFERSPSSRLPGPSSRTSCSCRPASTPWLAIPLGALLLEPEDLHADDALPRRAGRRGLRRAAWWRSSRAATIRARLGVGAVAVIRALAGLPL
jgi:hypothetical protein